jgi:hypothetical protein
MPIPKMNEPSSDNQFMLPHWDKAESIVDGIDSIKSQREKFLPKFPGESTEEYEFRLTFANMTNIYHDTLNGLASKPFEEEVTLIEKEKLPPELVEFIENVDGSGNNLTVFAGDVFFNGINNAIDWILIDYPKAQDTTKILTVQEQKEKKIKPFWSRILARNMLEVRSNKSGSNEELTYCRILEGEKVRVFEKRNALVVWELWEEKKDATGEKVWQIIEDGTISIGVIPIVPFITGRRHGIKWRFLPALRDAADLQITLYRRESALEFTTVLSAYPMLAGDGVRPEMDATGNPFACLLGLCGFSMRLQTVAAIPDRGNTLNRLLKLSNFRKRESEKQCRICANWVNNR